MLKPRVQTHNENGILLAEFWDCLRLDLGAVQDLRPKYDAHLKAGGRPSVVVDLLGVSYAGSSALGHFVSLQRHVRTKGGRIIFCNVDPTVFEVFRVSKLNPLFVFATDRPEALALAASGEAPVASAAIAAPVDTAERPRSPGGGGALRGRTGKKLS
jgi:anti-anti-sigma factor